MKAKEILVLVIMVMIIGFSIGYLWARSIYIAKIPVAGKPTTKYDTIVKPGEVIKIKGKGIITYTTQYDTIKLRDTIYNSRAFISVLDTIHQKDTIHVAYFFPLDLHYIIIRKGQDSIFTKTITIYQPVKEIEAWYKQPLTILGSAGAGFLIGKALK